MKNKITVVFILLAGIFAACEDIIEVELDNITTNLYAVEAKITTVDNPYVFLYKSQPVNKDETYNGISGATVTISDNSQPVNSVELIESDSNPGYYTVPEGNDYKGKTGKTYTLEIETEGVVLTATDTLSKVEPIDSIQVRASLRGDFLFLGVFTYGNEPEGEGDFYKWNVFINDTLVNDAQNLVIASDELVDGNYVNGFEIFTDFHDINKPEDRLLTLGDTIQVKQTSISEFAYYFYFQMLNQSQTGSMFSVPPANIESNFTTSDGSKVLGLFTAQDVSESNKIVIDQEIENQLKE